MVECFVFLRPLGLRLGCDVCADPIIGRNPCDQNFSFTEFFNEKPFTELVKANVTEIDIHGDTTSRIVAMSFCEPRSW